MFMKKLYGILLCVSLFVPIATQDRDPIDSIFVPIVLGAFLLPFIYSATQNKPSHTNNDISSMNNQTLNNQSNNQSGLENKEENNNAIVIATEKEDPIVMMNKEYASLFMHPYDPSCSIPENITMELAYFRQGFLDRVTLKDTNYPAIDDTTRTTLMDTKNALQAMRKNLTLHGVMKSNTLSFSGAIDAANLIALKNMNFIQCTGVINNSMSLGLTVFGRPCIIDGSFFKGRIDVVGDACMLAFQDCCVFTIAVHNEHTILELRNTLVAHDIVFDHPGIIVVDRNTVLNGKIVNAQVMMIE